MPAPGDGPGQAAGPPVPAEDGSAAGGDTSAAAAPAPTHADANASAEPRPSPAPTPPPPPPRSPALTARADRLAQTVHEQTDKAASHIAAAARAELARALEDVHLARRVNGIVAAHCGGLADDLAGWRDLGAAAGRKQAELAARAEAVVSDLAARMVVLEAGVADLEARSRALAVAVGVEGDGGGGGGGGGGGASGGAAAVSAALGRAARRALQAWPPSGVRKGGE